MDTGSASESYHLVPTGSESENCHLVTPGSASENYHLVMGKVKELNIKIREMQLEMNKLEAKRYKIQSRCRLLDRSNSRRLTMNMLVDFVNAIEKAYQYFEFKDSLRNYACPKYGEYTLDELKDLVDHYKLDPKFNKLVEKDFVSAVEAHTQVLKLEHLVSQRPETLKRLKAWEGKKRKEREELSAEDLIRMKNTLPCTDLENPARLDNHAFFNPIFSLVFEVRQKVCAMDSNPCAELQKFMDSRPFIHHVSQLLYDPVGISRPNPDYEPGELSPEEKVEGWKVAQALRKYKELRKLLQPVDEVQGALQIVATSG